MKKILFTIMVLLLTTSAWGQVVNNSGSEAADSIAISFYLVDSAGNMTAIADGDSVFLVVFDPSGAVAYQDSGAYNDGDITAQTRHGMSWYSWQAAVADIDGDGSNGLYSYIFTVHDKTSADLWTPHRGFFQLYTGNDYDGILGEIAEALDTLQAQDDWIAHQSTIDSTYDSLALLAGFIGYDADSTLLDFARRIADSSLGVIDAIDIATGAINYLKLADNCISAAKIQDGAFASSKFAPGWLDAADISAGTFTAAMFQSDFITADKIATNAITASELAGDAAAEVAGQVWTYSGGSGRLIQGATAGALVAADFDSTFFNAITDSVWQNVSRTLTAFDEDDMTIDLDGTTIGLLSTAGMDALWQYDTSLVASGIGLMLKDTSAYQGAAAGLDSATVYAAMAELFTDSTANLDDMKMAVWNTPWDTGYTAGSIGDSLSTAAYVQGEISTLTALAIADAVWDEAQSGHVSAGTFGYYLDNQVSAVSATLSDAQMGLLADSVWNKVLTDWGSGDSTAQAGEYVYIAGDSSLWADITSIYSVDTTTIDTSRFAAWIEASITRIVDTTAEVTVEDFVNGAITASAYSDNAITATKIESGAYASIAQRVWGDTTISYAAGNFGRLMIDLSRSFFDSLWVDSTSNYSGLDPYTFTRADSSQAVVWQGLRVVNASKLPIVRFHNTMDTGGATSRAVQIESDADSAYAAYIFGDGGGGLRVNATGGSGFYITGTSYGMYASGGDIGVRFVGDTALFIDGVETDLYFDSLGLPIESLIGYYVWNLDTAAYSGAGTFGILLDAKVSDAGAVVSISDADISTMMDSLFLRQVSDTVSQADSTYMARLLKYASVGGAGGADTASIHAMMTDAGFLVNDSSQIWKAQEIQIGRLAIIGDNPLGTKVASFYVQNSNSSGSARAVSFRATGAGSFNYGMEVLATNGYGMTVGGSVYDINLVGTGLINGTIDSIGDNALKAMEDHGFIRYDTSGGTLNLTRLNVIGSVNDSGVVNFINTADAVNDYAMLLDASNGIGITAEGSFGGGRGIEITANSGATGTGIYINADDYAIYGVADGASSRGAYFQGAESGIYAYGSTYGMRLGGGSGDLAFSTAGTMYTVGDGGVKLSSATRATLVDNVWDEDTTGHYTDPNMAYWASQTSATALTASALATAVWAFDDSTGIDASQVGEWFVNNTGGIGSGSYSLTITAVDTSTTPDSTVGNVNYHIFATSGQSELFRALSNGQLIINANANDTLIVNAWLPGYNFAQNDTIFMGSADKVDSVIGYSLATATKTRVFAYINDINGNPVQGAVFTAQLFGQQIYNTCDSTVPVIYSAISTLSDANGYAYMDVTRTSCLDGISMGTDGLGYLFIVKESPGGDAIKREFVTSLITETYKLGTQ